MVLPSVRCQWLFFGFSRGIFCWNFWERKKIAGNSPAGPPNGPCHCRHLQLGLCVRLALSDRMVVVAVVEILCVERLLEMIESNVPKISSTTRDKMLDRIRVCRLFDLSTLLQILTNLVENLVNLPILQMYYISN